MLEDSCFTAVYQMNQLSAVLLLTLSDLAKYSMTRSARGLSVTAELLVVSVYDVTVTLFSCWEMAVRHVLK